MCTLVALFGVVPGYPLVVAMNRDEFYERPSLPPDTEEHPTRLVAPRDARAKGTWIGVNKFGLVAAVSNRFAGTNNPSARSRGLLCLETLGNTDVAAASMFASEAPEHDAYNSFNLLLADTRRIACTSHEASTWTAHGMKGVNVLTNAGLNQGDLREKRVRTLLQGMPTRTIDDAVRAIRRALSDHTDAGGRAICHHGEKTGTRSQTIIGVSAAGWQHNRLWYSDGFPCTVNAEELSKRFSENAPPEVE